MVSIIYFDTSNERAKMSATGCWPELSSRGALAVGQDLITLQGGAIPHHRTSAGEGNTTIRYPAVGTRRKEVLSCPWPSGRWIWKISIGAVMVEELLKAELQRTGDRRVPP